MLLVSQRVEAPRMEQHISVRKIQSQLACRGVLFEKIFRTGFPGGRVDPRVDRETDRERVGDILDLQPVLVRTSLTV